MEPTQTAITSFFIPTRKLEIKEQNENSYLIQTKSQIHGMTAARIKLLSLEVNT